MTVEGMMVFLAALANKGSEELRVYRERKAQGGICRVCGVEGGGEAYCAGCYDLVKQAQRLARSQGVCSTCFSAPTAPGKKHWGRRPVTRCLGCRERDEARRFASELERAVGV